MEEAGSGTNVIRDVWQQNLEDEFRIIRQVIQKYKYVAVDTNFPGIVARPIGNFANCADYTYEELKCNVRLLKMIQIGFTFMDEDGNVPTDCSTWQFNFKFSLKTDMYAQDTIDLLKSAGIQFEKHESEGVHHDDFAELLTSSGIVLLEDVSWLCFHPVYDFGYLVKALSGEELPAEEEQFLDMLKTFFPNTYDCKYILHNTSFFRGGLEDIAFQLDVNRVGQQHQAGSDALLTGMIYFKMRQSMLGGVVADKFCGKIFGLGSANCELYSHN